MRKTHRDFLFILSIILSLNAQATDPKRPSILGIAHCAFCVKYLEDTRLFYKDFLGFDEPYSLKSKDGKSMDMTFFKVNDRQLIEIFPEKLPDAERFLHFAIETDNAESMRQFLAQKGCKVPEKVSIGRSGNKNFFVKDPAGNSCEIVQYLPGGLTLKNAGKNLPSTRVSRSIRHVGIMVPDLDAELKFYVDLLGFKETWRGSYDSISVTWVHLKVPDGNQFIELMLYDKPLNNAEKGSLNHICLEVDSLSYSINTLQSRRLPVGCKMDKPRIGKNHKRLMNLFDGDGTRVEIMEPNTIDGKMVPSSTLTPKKYIP